MTRFTSTAGFQVTWPPSITHAPLGCAITPKPPPRPDSWSARRPSPPPPPHALAAPLPRAPRPPFLPVVLAAHPLARAQVAPPAYQLLKCRPFHGPPFRPAILARRGQPANRRSPLRGAYPPRPVATPR